MMPFDYEQFRQAAVSYTEQAIIDLVTDTGELAPVDWQAENQAELWAWGLVRELLQIHSKEQELESWDTTAVVRK